MMNSNVTDLIRFFYSFVQSPKKIGSIIPSSAFLAREMFRPFVIEETNTLIELGAGTGVFTKRIAERIPKESFGLIFEQNDQMRNRLAVKYPNLHYYSNALDMVKVVEELGAPNVDVVVSSLPFANFSKDLREQLVLDIYQILKPNGTLVAYQYSWQMKQLLESLFDDVSISFVPFNIPPAFVFTCNKIDQ